MNPLTILWLWRMGGIVVLLGSLTASYFGWRTHERNIGRAEVTAVYETALTKQKADAAALLATETTKAATATKALQDFKTQQESDDAINEKTVSILADKLHALSGADGRLRDPHQTGCGGGSGGAQRGDPASAGNSGQDGAQTGGLLSPELTQFLLTKDWEADAINLAYISCRADAAKVRETLR